jgi:SAM-dependent MidA family methyltransferase
VTTPLAAELKRLIAIEGPLTVEAYMAHCLGHPRYGYYMTRDPFGAGGDFITAPEISQMFGELLGLWAAETWRLMGEPAAVNLVELGPGRGTLMADALRAARVMPPFREALDIHLVETSPVLRARQQATLAGEKGLSWHGTAATLPGGPSIILANEFFDALPVRQFVRTPAGWCERRVGGGDDGAFVFGLDAEPAREITAAAPVGAVLELPQAGLALLAELGARLARDGGVLIAIDYGHVESGFGDTLQAVRQHRYVDVLAEPGEVDLTTHVDFALLGRAARQAGLAVHGPVSQGDFLVDLGIRERAAVLKRGREATAAVAIDEAVARLVGAETNGKGEGDRTEAGMGRLFKVAAFAHPALPPLPGFSP